MYTWFVNIKAVHHSAYVNKAKSVQQDVLLMHIWNLEMQMKLIKLSLQQHISNYTNKAKTYN